MMIPNAPASDVFNETDARGGMYRQKEEELFSFIKKFFIGSKGEIYTNLSPGQDGKETLAESAGLLLGYCVKRGHKKLFDTVQSYFKENLLTDGYFVKWRTGENVTCNAAIDDLRIMRALMEAYDRWGDISYFDTAGFMQEGIFNRQTSGGSLYELYDWKS
jgi:endo-1,4-beta-D-glucanase Y